MHQARHGSGSAARHSADTSASPVRHAAGPVASPVRHAAATSVMSRIRPRVLVALVVAGAGLTTAIWLPTRHDAADASERARNKQQAQNERRVSQQDQFVFADNFSGGQGSRVDTDKWSVKSGSRNAALDGDGHLVLTARKQRSGEFAGAELQTRKSFTQSSGQVEARIKVADGNGILSAFRLLGADVDADGRSNAGEVDVAQNAGQESHVVHGALQVPGRSADDELSGSVNAKASFADDFHTYAVTWQPDLIVWSVDGAEFFRATTVDPRFFDQPFLVSLDLTADAALSKNTRSPERMLVDFVHVTAFDDKTPPSDDPTTAPPTTAPPTTAPTTAPTTQPPATTAPTTAPPATVAPTTPPTSEAPAPAATPWKPFTDYIAGQLVTYEGVEYQVQETHTSLPGWEPPALPNLFKKL